MDLDLSDGFVPADAPADDLDNLPIFTIERVQLQFSIAADFAAAQVANNVIILALSNGRILRIDLNRPEDIDDIDLPRKASDVGVIRRMFLDPTASHLIICTAAGENYYLHSQSRQPRPLSRLRGVPIESIAWNPSLPTASTREILIGAADGNIYEAFIETSNEFYKREVKHLKSLHKLPDGPIAGLWADIPAGRPDTRRVVIATQSRLFHLTGKVGHSNDGSGSVYSRLFESEQPVVHELTRSVAGAPCSLVVSPDPPDADPHGAGEPPERAYAWLSSQGVFHGKLLSGPADASLGARVLSGSRMLAKSQIVTPEGGGARRRAASDAVDAIALTQWHIVSLVGARVVTTNRLTGRVVSEHEVLGAGQTFLGFSVDLQKNTFWLFTADEMFEIVVRDEERDIWEILMKQGQFEQALRQARTRAQKETVAAAYGDHLASRGHWDEAAVVYGRSSKPFEDIALGIVDSGQADALRKFLLTRLGVTPKSSTMQRMMLAGWLVEVFMAKLDSLDDAAATQADVSAAGLDAEGDGGAGAGAGADGSPRRRLGQVRREYEAFVDRYKGDLDRRTVYDVVGGHGREEELLYFASAVDDYGYVLSYWVQRERWSEVLDVLRRQTDPEAFYRHSSVLMRHAPRETVELLMRHPELEARRLIPALLEYNASFAARGGGGGEGGKAQAQSQNQNQNQAVRYLNYQVYQLGSEDAAVHNTLVSMHAAQPSRDESGLLAYLEAQGEEARYDADFALRLCIQHHRTLSCVHIYTSMGQYVQAVDLALAHDEVELAAVVADRPTGRPGLRKRLWLAVARRVISRSRGIKAAVEFLGRCELLRIEDLIPLFPDFVVIDDFRDEICGALEEYGRGIEGLEREMDESSATAGHIRADIAGLDRRYAVVEPGERCCACGLPLLSRQFFVFPCQHSFHSDCLGRRVLEGAGPAAASRIRDLQMQIHRGLVAGARREAVVSELDSLVASSCILCSDFAIKRVDEPFVTKDDNPEDWAL